MNIGIFTDTYTPQVNGVVSSIVTLETQLRAQGHQVYIFTVSHPKADKNEKYVYRLPSMPFVFLKDHRVGLLYSPKLVRKVKKAKLDLILSQTEFSLGLFAKMISKRLHIPIIHTYHTMYEEYMHYVSKGVELSPELARKYSKKFCNGVSGVVAPTEKTKRLLESYGVRTPICVIPTGIDFTPFNPENYTEAEINALSQTFGIDCKAPVILFVGRIAKEKSIDIVFKAFSILLDVLPKAQLVLVGDGPERCNLELLATELGIEEKVIFTGMQPWDTIGKFYQLGDVFVSASVSETQGLTFAEAMAAKLPVLAKKDESIEGVVRDGYNGRIFETTEELASLLQSILSSTETLNLYGENALESIEPLSAEKFGESALRFYNDILESYHTDQLNKKSHKKWLKKQVSKEDSVQDFPHQENFPGASS